MQMKMMQNTTGMFLWHCWHLSFPVLSHLLLSPPLWFSTSLSIHRYCRLIVVLFPVDRPKWHTQFWFLIFSKSRSICMYSMMAILPSFCYFLLIPYLGRHQRGIPPYISLVLLNESSSFISFHSLPPPFIAQCLTQFRLFKCCCSCCCIYSNL